MRPTLEILGDLMWRPPATEAEHWFGVALVKHLHEGLPLAQALGIPRTANRLRIEMRNFHLIRAAQALPDMRPRTLIAAVAAFRDYRWPKWGGLEYPPPGASICDSHLWYAASSWPLPDADGLTRILADSRGIVAASASYSDDAHHHVRKDEQP